MSLPRIASVARRDVPICGPQERAAAVLARLRQARWKLGVVSNEQHVVLGLIRDAAVDVDQQVTVEDVMSPAPPTFRPNMAVAEAANHMRRRALDQVLVTTSNGELIGVLYREDLKE